MAQHKSLQTIVGTETYQVWTEMLKGLVPNGRTHRLSVLVAGMLQHAYNLASEKYDFDDPGDAVVEALFEAADAYEPDELKELHGIIVQLFNDAGVPYQRRNSKGRGYSIVQETIYEFIHWENMPWES